jgi:hypothetical protein
MTFTESTFQILASLSAAERAPVHPLIRKLRSFGQLAPGWSHGEGIPVAVDAIRIAERYVDAATILQLRADVFPGINGDCAVAFYQGDKSVEIVISPGAEDRLGLHVENGSGFQFETVLQKDDATHSEVISEITKLVTDAWKSPAFSRSVNSTQSEADFQISSSSMRQEPLLELRMAS